jgi:hypothetical protein
MKRNEAKNAKQNETKEPMRKKAKRNILKRNEGKTVSIYFYFEPKQKL